MLAEIQHRLLGLEQRVAKARGATMGWTNIDERGRQIIKAVAKAATEAGLGNIKAKDFRLRTRVGTFTGIKVTDSQHTSLSDFWRLVEDVRERTGGYATGLLGEDKLVEAVRQTIEDKKSGELDRRQRAREELSDRWDFPRDLDLTILVRSSRK